MKSRFLKTIPLIAALLSACGNDRGTTPTDTPASSDGQSSSSNTTTASSSSFDPSTLTWHDIDPTHPKIRATGRGDYSDPAATRFAWSGSAWSVAFWGTAAKIKLNAPGSIFNVFLDGDTVPSAVLNLAENDGTEHLLADNLPWGLHTITVFKRTEAQYGDAVFGGFRVLGTAEPADLPQAPTRKLEFIGNSITCGYGNLDSIKENHFDITTEDHYYTYAAMTARALNAEHHAICFSGRGVYRNNTGSTQGTLPQLFNLVSPSSSKPWDFSRWIPDVVLINLGTNDFYQGIPDSAGFVNATVLFVQQIREKYPQSRIVLLDGPMLTDYYPPVDPADVNQFPPDPSGYPSAYYLRSVKNGDTTYTYRSQTVCKRFLNAAREALIAQGLTGISRFSFPAQTGRFGYGADWHPSKAQHYYMAELLTIWMKTELGW